jgi:hypothetical protein
MKDDEINHQKAAGEAIFASETELDHNVAERLRTALRDLNSTTRKTLSPKAVAKIHDGFKHTYIFYSHLSSDSAHPTVTALNRYTVTGQPEGDGFDAEPPVSSEEVVATFGYLSMACIGVCVAVNQIIDGAVGMSALADRYSALANASAGNQSAEKAAN